MTPRKRPIEYERRYVVADDAPTASELREVEAILARLIAAAYFADHPELRLGEQLSGDASGAAAQPLARASCSATIVAAEGD